MVSCLRCGNSQWEIVLKGVEQDGFEGVVYEESQSVHNFKVKVDLVQCVICKRVSKISSGLSSNVNHGSGVI